MSPQGDPLANQDEARQIQSNRANQQHMKWQAVKRLYFCTYKGILKICACTLVKVKNNTQEDVSCPPSPSPPFPFSSPLLSSPPLSTMRVLRREAMQSGLAAAPLPLSILSPTLPFLYPLLRNKMVWPSPNTMVMDVDVVWGGVFHKEESFGCRSVARLGEDGLSHSSASCWFPQALGWLAVPICSEHGNSLVLISQKDSKWAF